MFRIPRPEFAPLNFWAQAGGFVVGKAIDMLGSGGIQGDEKAMRALKGPTCGTYPHSVETVYAAYMRAPLNVRAGIRAEVTEKSWIAPVVQTDLDVINCGLWLAEGGIDCSRGAQETRIKAAFDSLMANYGGPVPTIGPATSGYAAGAIEGQPVVYTPDPGPSPTGQFRTEVGQDLSSIVGGIQDSLAAIIQGGTSGAAQAAGGGAAGAEAEASRIAAGSIFGIDTTTILIGGLALVAVLFAVKR